jgi:hypothetical protein
MATRLSINMLVVFLVFGVSTLPVIDSVSAATTTSSAVSSSLDLGCPSPPGAPHGIQVWIHVVQWCGLAAVRGQDQFKLQMQIYNSGKRTLNIGQAHIRLIVARFDPSKWSPPQKGAPTEDRPFRTTISSGEHVWAVPPNAEDAYDPVPGIPGDLTFATHWGQYNLGPGQVFHPSYHSGDLVFYLPHLPHDPTGLVTKNDVLGVAYVYGREIVVLCPKERWGHKEPAASF